MRAELDHAAAVDHGDAVRLANRGQAVGDNEGRAILHQAVERFLHQMFAFAIEGAGGLVEDEDRRVLE